MATSTDDATNIHTQPRKGAVHLTGQAHLFFSIEGGGGLLL
jgi:hypothetical protein